MVFTQSPSGHLRRGFSRITIVQSNPLSDDLRFGGDVAKNLLPLTAGANR